MKFKLPPNGSFQANLVILVMGGLAGSGLTSALRSGGLFGNSSASVESVRKSRPSASDTAPVKRSGGPRNPQQPLSAVTVQEMTVLERGEHFRKLGTDAAMHDIIAALAEADTISSKQDQLSFLRGVFSVWSKTDPEGALSHIQSKIPVGTTHSELIGLAMHKWGHTHPREAWLWAENHLDGPLKERALNDLVVGWTRQSPADAAKWLAGSGLTSTGLFTALARTWAESDPIAAFKWVKDLPPEAPIDKIIPAIIDPIAANNPEEVLRIYPELAEGANPDAVVAFTNRWAATNLTDAAKWVDSLPQGVTRNEAAATLAAVWATSDINSAVKWGQSINDPALRQKVVSHLGTTWGAIQPYEALEWLSKLPANEAAEGIRGAYYSWAATDPVGLEEWVNETGTNAASDQGRRSLADVRSQKDPGGAMTLALGHSVPETRDQLMARYYGKWLNADPATAGDWYDMNAAKLPASTRQRLTAESVKNKVSPPANNTGGGRTPTTEVPGGI